MGCALSAPAAVGDSSKRTPGTGVGASTPGPVVDAQSKAAVIVSPREVLALAHAVVAESFKDDIDPVALAAIALTESSGRATAVHLNEDVGEARIGLCQVHLSTAKWLYSMKGYCRYQEPSAAELEVPERCLYYCAAYLQVLLSLGQSEVQAASEGAKDFDLEQFVIRPFHAGPKSWNSERSTGYWARYQHARWQLQRLQDALDASAAAPPGSVVMHVVHHSETLAKVAAVCGLKVEDILACNPELGPDGAVQANDCIALPIPLLLPNVYAVRPGDTLQSVAKAAGLSAHRLLARNPELREPKVFAPGWVLSLPGLRGEHTHEGLSERCAPPSSSGGSSSPYPASRHPLHSTSVVVGGGGGVVLMAAGALGSSVQHGQSAQEGRGNSGSSGVAHHMISELRDAGSPITAPWIHTRCGPVDGGIGGGAGAGGSLLLPDILPPRVGARGAAANVLAVQ